MSPTFLALLSAYYLCDAAAALRPLPPDTAQHCAAQYEAVKSSFVPGADSGPAERRLGYLRFKSWEADNPDVVGELRRAAADEARALLIGKPV
ncbi:MAG: hypothetical protein AAF865_16590 [Pseudomonadota bacterium]